MQTNTLFRIALLAIVPAVISADASAGTYRNLCDSVAKACEYTGPDAPVLRSNVCWDGNMAVLQGWTCPSGTRTYYVEHGEVLDPLTGVVQGYIPLDWACDYPDICVDDTPPPQASAVPICCWGGTCYPLTEAGCPDGSAKVLCKSGVSNNDGTVTCFEGQQLP